MADRLVNVIGVKEAAKLWGISPTHVKHLCQTGQIEAKKLGNTWAIAKDQEFKRKRGKR